MKELFTAFPLLKSWKFYLLLALLLGLSLATAFLYLPEEKNLALPFDEEEGQITAALTAAEKKLETASEEERDAISEEKAFFEAALKFRLSPWSSYFGEEALTLYARLSATGQREELAELEKILAQRDKESLLAFAKDYPEISIDKRLLLAEDEPENAGQNALLYEITLLEESLARGKDAYFGTEKSLTDSEKQLFTRLLSQKEKTLSEGAYNPVPANRETLLLAERFFATLLTVLLLAVAGVGRKLKQRELPLFALPIVLLVLLFTAALCLATLLGAPGTAEPVYLQWGGSLPFFPAVLLRLCFRVLGSLPLMLPALRFREKKSGWKLFALLPVLRFLLRQGSLLFPRALARALLWGELAECVFPTLAPFSLNANFPWVGIFLWLLALGASLFFLLRKEQKLTPAKQKISLEKSSDL